MTNNLFLSEIMFVTIACIAALVMRQFIISRDGTLRKIMITYFAVEIWIYGSSGLYFWLIANTNFSLSIDVFRLICLAPKALVKVWLYVYMSEHLIKNDNKL